MADVDEQLRDAFEDFAARYGGTTSIPPRTVRALSRSRRRLRFGPAVTMAAAVVTVLLVVGAVALVGSRTHRSSPAVTTPSPPPILQPGQFVGLIDPGDKNRGQQYAWIFDADGHPSKRLARALGVLGVTWDRRQALIEQYPKSAGNSHIGGCFPHGVEGLPTAVLSLADGSLARPFPSQPGVEADVIGGHLVAGIVVREPSPAQGCAPPRLLVGDLATGQTIGYRLTSWPGISPRSRPRVVAISPDGHWAIIENVEHPDHLVFYFASLNAGSAHLTELPSAPGCTQSAFTAYPRTNDLTSTAACGRTITITTYRPDTLAVTRTEHISDPPGAAVTFAELAWNADGSQALVEAMADGTAPWRGIFVWRDGNLTRIATRAYGVVW